MVNTHDLPEAFALGASADRIVEAEHLRAGLLEDSPVSLEDIAELLQAYRLTHTILHLFDSQGADASPLEESGIYGFAKAIHGLQLFTESQAVYEQVKPFGTIILPQQRILNSYDAVLRPETTIPLLQLDLQMSRE